MIGMMMSESVHRWTTAVQWVHDVDY